MAPANSSVSHSPNKVGDDKTVLVLYCAQVFYLQPVSNAKQAALAGDEHEPVVDVELLALQHSVGDPQSQTLVGLLELALVDRPLFQDVDHAGADHLAFAW